ncbi:Hypothetical Protein FCC1311_037342 [Hondaea fermentalgiana]|uniref:Uncharacterized protein n=1 Tax=Hondaea fermentalgiana TaxID=2315210 RepID=A0A2R5GGW5_9STRA|nr:Hypothetical Protein FCC1311_037342 [Hondaea fermentalgiana]|eukprot:GBG27511.1 Hypothetical Protein FCC1311_037342 [Hondaea fermentalgiana]
MQGNQLDAASGANVSAATLQVASASVAPPPRRNVRLTVDTQAATEESSAESSTPTPRVRLRWSPRPVLSPSPRGAVPEAALMTASAARTSTARSSNPQDGNATLANRMRAGAGFHRERLTTMAELPFVRVNGETAVTVSSTTA